VGIFADTIHAQDFPREVETGDLFSTIVCGLVRLDRAGAHRVDRLEVVSFPVKVLAFLQGFAALDNVIQLLNVVVFQSQRQADTIESAIATIDLVIVGAGYEAFIVGGFCNMVGHDHVPRHNTAQYS
jgi:hypothetical protein